MERRLQEALKERWLDDEHLDILHQLGINTLEDVDSVDDEHLQGPKNVGVMGSSSYFTRAGRWPHPIPLEDVEMTNSHSLEDIQNGSLAFLMRNIIASYHQIIELSY